MAVLLIATDLPAGGDLDDTRLGRSLAGSSGWATDPSTPDVVGTVMVDHDTALVDGALDLIRVALADGPDIRALIADAAVLGVVQLRGAWSPTRIANEPDELHLVVSRDRREAGGILDRIDALADAADSVGHLPAVLTERAAALEIATTTRRAALRLETARLTSDPAPSVSVIIPTAGARGHDGRPLVIDAVRAARSGATTDTATEILIVVGDEYDGDPDDLIDGDDVRLVRRPPGPWNFSATVNLGLLEARNDLVLLLNDDIEQHQPGWLDPMAHHLRDPSVGAVGALLLYPDGNVQHAGMVVDDALPLHCFSGMSLQEVEDRHGLVPRDMAAVTGACLLARRSELLELGGLNEALPFSFNDVDLCFKVLRHGKRVVFEPRARLTHHEGASREPVTHGWEWDTFVRRWGEIVDPWYHPGFVRPNDPHDRRRNADHIVPEAPPEPAAVRTPHVRSRVHHARSYEGEQPADTVVGSPS